MARCHRYQRSEQLIRVASHSKEEGESDVRTQRSLTLTETAFSRSQGGAPPPVASVQDLVKVYTRGRHESVTALNGVSLDFPPGAFVVLLGPSGCGKTTLLRSIAGLERPDSGDIRLRSQLVFSASEGIYQPPERRGLSMMFQSYALWPNMTVADNVCYPLRSRRGAAGDGSPRARRLSRAEINDLMRKALTMVGIPELEHRYPNQLSGGQQQRVALARAVVWRDDIVLFDEPLSNVDARVRDDLRRELAEMQRSLGFTGVYVTHDQAEAMQLGDRIVVMRSGRIEQQGSPRDVYLRPRNRFVANFVGASNEIPGKVSWVSPGTSAEVTTGVGKIRGRLPEGCPVALSTEVVVAWRPESGVLSDAQPGGPNMWSVRLADPVFLGTHTEYIAHVGENRVRVLQTSESAGAPHEGSELWLSVDPENVSILPLVDA